MNYLLLLIGLVLPENVQVLKSYQSPEKVSEEYLAFPQSIDFAEDGRLFLVDSNQAKVFVWNKDGTFKGSLVDKGKGPGEILFPQDIRVHGNYFYVLEASRQLISKFTLDGEFVKIIKTTGMRGQTFGPLTNDQFLMAYKTFQWKSSSGKNDHRYWLVRLNPEGEKETVKWFPNTTYLSEERTRPWGSILDIQRGPDSHWYVGCSEDRHLYKLDDSGKIIGKTRFEIPAQQPTGKEKDWFEDLSLPLPSGGHSVANSKESDPVRYDYTAEKAHYTHFLIKGDKVIFALTPLGDFNGMGMGFWQATYYINDMKTGKTLSRGSYDFPVDSKVFYRGERIMAFIYGEDDGFSIREITVKGF